MRRPVDYDRRKALPSNMLIEATDWYDYTKDYHLKVWEDVPCEDCEDEDEADIAPRTIENPGVTVAFVEDGTDIIRDMVWLSPDQCEALGKALLAVAAKGKKA